MPAISFLPASLAVLLAAGLTGLIVFCLRRHFRQRASLSGFADLLQEVRRVSRQQYAVGAQYLNVMLNSQSNDVSNLMQSLLLPSCVGEPGACLPVLAAAFRKGHSVKLCARLLRLRDELKYQHSSLLEFGRQYATRVKQSEDLYYENIFELSKMHDQLETYMHAKNTDKGHGGEWYETYLSVFSAWFRGGASKDVETTYNQIVVKVIQLNRLYSASPFALQTNLYVMNCDLAYGRILALNDELRARIRSYTFFHKLGYKSTLR